VTMSGGKTMVAVSVLVGLDCAHPQAAPPHLPPGPTVLMISAGHPCPGSPAPDVSTLLAHEADLLSKRIQELGRWHIEPLAPNRRTVTDRIREVDGPLWLIYGGHGVIDGKGRSALCLDDEVPVDELLAALPPKVPTAVLMLNACRSANVDLQNAGSKPVTVISAATDTIENLFPHAQASETAAQKITTVRTIFGTVLESVLGNRDQNCDGWATDRELFDQMKARTPYLTWLGAAFRFRSSAWSDIPLVRVPTHGPCQTCRDQAQALRTTSPLLERFLEANPTVHDPAYHDAGYLPMIAAPHVVARFAGPPPVQQPAKVGVELIPIVDPSWRVANALAALTPLRMLVSFDEGAHAGDPCQTSKWRPADPAFATHPADLLVPAHERAPICFEIGGPAREILPAGTVDEIGRAAVCPADCDVGQCFEVRRK
jgi:hypothetical protein